MSQILCVVWTPFCNYANKRNSKYLAEKNKLPFGRIKQRKSILIVYLKCLYLTSYLRGNPGKLPSMVTISDVSGLIVPPYLFFVD